MLYQKNILLSKIEFTNYTIHHITTHFGRIDDNDKNGIILVKGIE